MRLSDHSEGVSAHYLESRGANRTFSQRMLRAAAREAFLLTDLWVAGTPRDTHRLPTFLVVCIVALLFIIEDLSVQPVCG